MFITRYIKNKSQTLQKNAAVHAYAHGIYLYRAPTQTKAKQKKETANRPIALAKAADARCRC